MAVQSAIMKNKVLVNFILEQIKLPGSVYSVIASNLNRKAKIDPAGFGRPGNGEWDASAVSWIAIRSGFRRHAKRHEYSPNSHHKKADKDPSPPPSVPAVTKWDVLKCIESCGDLSPSARKALLALVWQELNK